VERLDVQSRPRNRRLRDAPFGERATFRLNKAALRAQGASTALLDQVGSSAYRYFRLVARPFAARTCYEFRDLRWRLPSVAVHGDAHIEQFVVTNEAYGLADFDRAGFGPAVVGHGQVRGLDSLSPAVRPSGRATRPKAVAAYFDAYRAALDLPRRGLRPTVVDRSTRRPPSGSACLAAVGGRLDASDASRRSEQALRDGWFRFVDLMTETCSSTVRGRSTGSPAVGRVEIGIGSALEPKTLIRIDGPTDVPDDDLILEARITATPDGRDCVSRPLNGGSLDVLMFASLLGQRLPEVFGLPAARRRARGAGAVDSVVGPAATVSWRSPISRRRRT
jgi:hypothetical protein